MNPGSRSAVLSSADSSAKISALAGDAERDALTVAHVERPSYDEFRRRFLKRRQPALITGAFSDWAATRRWNVDYIEQTLGDCPIAPLVMEEGRMHLDVRQGMRVDAMDFPTYRRQVEGNVAPPYYLRLPLEGRVADLFRADYETPVYCNRRIFMKANLWIGQRGLTTGLHYDMTHNLVAQVTGRRHVILFPPEEKRNLYPYPLRTLSWHHSRVDLDAPDLARFPRLTRTRRTEVDLGPGDMLFIPQGWWHRFSTVENAIAVNFFWLTKRLAPAMVLARVAWVLTGIRT